MISLAPLALLAALAAPPDRPYLTPWVVVRPGDAAPPSAAAPPRPGVNAPGLLVEVRASEVGDVATPEAVRLARRTRRVIGENLAWAVAYNAVAVPLAAFGLVPPYWAAIGMSASSLVVVANAWKLGRGKGGVGAAPVAASDASALREVAA